MLNELLKKVNLLSYELEETRQASEDAEWNLLSARLSLEELNLRGGSAAVEERAAELHELIRRHTAEQPDYAMRISGLERSMADEIKSALAYIGENNIALAAVAAAEDDIITEIAIGFEENRILSRLFASQEALNKMQRRYDESKSKVYDAEQDEQICRAQTVFYNARRAADEFRAINAQATEAQKYSMMNEFFTLSDREAHAKIELERILEEDGVLGLFNELETAETALNKASAEYAEAKAASDMLPLAAPSNPPEKSGGVVTKILLRKTAGAADPQQDRREKEIAAAIMPDTKSAVGDKNADDKLSALISDRRKEELMDEMSAMTREIRLVRRQAAMLRKEAERAKMDMLLIRRAKYLAALSVKRAALAAKKAEQTARMLSRELRQDRDETS